MGRFKNIAMLIYGNTIGLPMGIKMLFSAALIATIAQYVGLSSETSWGLALACVILTTCLVTKFPIPTGKQK